MLNNNNLLLCTSSGGGGNLAGLIDELRARAHGWIGTHPRVTACVSPQRTDIFLARCVALGKR